MSDKYADLPPPVFAAGPEGLPGLDVVLSMPGLAFMEGIRDGTLPQAPIARLLNYRVTEVALGLVVFLGEPTFDHYNPLGTVHGGWYGTLLDSCMACAVMTHLPQGSYQTTLEFKVNLTRALPIGTQIEAIGTVSHAGRSTGVAQGEIRGVADGKLYATGSTTCLIIQGTA